MITLYSDLCLCRSVFAEIIFNELMKCNTDVAHIKQRYV